MINIYYDIASDKRVDSLGGNSISDLILKYQTKPTWRVNFLKVDKAAGTVEPLDLSGVVSWSAAVDDDFDHDSEPMCRTLNADIDASQAADGIIDVPIDANTETFETAIGKSELKREVFFELVGYDTNGEKVQSALMKIVAKNSVDPAGTTPLPIPDNFVTEAQLAAYVAGAWEIQYSIDGATLWHDEQAEEDRYIRLRPDNGIDWTDGILLVTGPKGEDGAAATIAVGTVTTGDAGSSVIVTNSGTEAAAVFDFTIPRGNTGTPGTNAPQVIFQYSADSVSWHSSYTAGDVYIRFSVDGGSNYGDAMQFSSSGVNTPLEFDNADLSVGVLTVPGLRPIIAVTDDDGKVIHPDEITYGATDTTVDIASFGTISGTWTVIFGQGKDGADGHDLQFQYSADNSSFHDVYNEGADFYRRESTDNGETWRTGYKFVATNRTNGTNAPATQIQYSVDGSTSWHSTFTTGDLYQRVSVDGGSTWSDAMKFVGEDGAAGADGDMTNPMTTAGDIIYGGVDGAPTRLAKGTAAQVLKMNSGATAPEWGTAASGGMWTLVERWEPGSAATNHTFSSLNGNTDRRYLLKLRVVVANSQYSNDIWVNLNGDTTAHYMGGWTQVTGTSTSNGQSTSLTGMSAGFAAVNATEVNSELEIYAKSGVYRTGIKIGESSNNSGHLSHENGSNIWPNSSDNITSLSVTFGTNGFGVGSCIELWKLAQ